MTTTPTAPDPTSATAPSSVTRDAPPASAVAPQGGDIAGVLIALQFLQAQSASVNAQQAKRLGVGGADFQAMIFLSVNGPLPPKRVAEHLGLSSGALTALADRLETAGLITRHEHPTDRRSFNLGLTADGETGVNETGRLYGRAVQEALVPSDRALVEGAFLQLGTALRSLAA